MSLSIADKYISQEWEVRTDSTHNSSNKKVTDIADKYITRSWKILHWGSDDTKIKNIPLEVQKLETKDAKISFLIQILPKNDSFDEVSTNIIEELSEIVSSNTAINNILTALQFTLKRYWTLYPKWLNKTTDVLLWYQRISYLKNITDPNYTKVTRILQSDDLEELEIDFILEALSK